jgi:hypothetical protein
MKIVFVGNFSVPFSTESHHKWTWEHLGHQVVALQENRTTTDEIIAACQGAQVFQWTHTHGYSFGGTVTQDEMVKRIRAVGLTSFSYHLDVYFGLDQLDRRETNLGKHPSFRLDYFFSTDGGNHPWKEKGINHIWMPPGIVESGCYRGEHMAVLASDVGFVGSIGYHPEFAYRTQLVEQLKKHYGSRFRTYAGMREKALNNTYASTRCVVGDHCFSTNPDLKYWSDRLPETLGRAGFMVYPNVAGLEEFIANGLVTYKAGNFDDLYSKVDYYLDSAHNAEKEERRTSLLEYVKKNHTYTVRLQQILNVMGLRGG